MQTGDSIADLWPTTKIPSSPAKDKKNKKEYNHRLKFSKLDPINPLLSKVRKALGERFTVILYSAIIKTEVEQSLLHEKTMLSCTIHSVQLLWWNGIHIEMHPKKKTQTLTEHQRAGKVNLFERHDPPLCNRPCDKDDWRVQANSSGLLYGVGKC